MISTRIESQNACPARGFTLVELLVVIAIAALLLTMLIPSLNQAREVARRVVCQSIEHQNGIAFGTYNSDNKGAFPYVNSAATPVGLGTYQAFGSFATPWTQAIGIYMGGSIYGDTPKSPMNYNALMKVRCPSNPWFFTGTGNGIQPANWAGSTYGMNASPSVATGPQWPFPYSYANAAFGDPYLDPHYFFTPANVEKLFHPSALMLIGEVPNATPAQKPWLTPSYAIDPWINNGFPVTSLWQTQINTYGPDAAEMIDYVRVNHNLGWNVLKADSSCFYYTKAQMETIATTTVLNNAFFKDK